MSAEAAVLEDQLYSVTELADDLGITPRALRLYEDKGLISPQRAGANRVYTRRERARMILILRGKRLGFSLRDIGEWLDLYDADPGHLAQARLALRKIESRIARLLQQRDDLERTLSELNEIRDEAQEHLLRASGMAAHE